MRRYVITRYVTIRYSISDKHVRVHESNPVSGETKLLAANASKELETPTLRSSTYAPSSNSLQSPPTSAVSSTVFSAPSSTTTQPKELPSLQPAAARGLVPSPPSGLVGIIVPAAGRNGPASLAGTGFSPLIPKPNIFSKVGLCLLFSSTSCDLKHD